MAISAGAVAVLARQAVDLLDPRIEIDVVPDPANDPYRFDALAWTVWPLVDSRRSFGVHLDATMSPAEALATLLDTMSENVGETRRCWGVGFPTCPGHVHPADVRADAAGVALSCPSTGQVVQRIDPSAG